MVTEFKLSHQSNQMEAGRQRQVMCELPAIAMADMAEKISVMASGSHVELTGFLAMKNRMSKQLVLHVCDTRLV